MLQSGAYLQVSNLCLCLADVLLNVVHMSFECFKLLAQITTAVFALSRRGKV